MNIKTFEFNYYGVNTYVVYDDTKKNLIIDPACYSNQEFEELKKYISDNQLQPEYIVLTHGHVDHIPGVSKIQETYNIPLLAHNDTNIFLNTAHETAYVFGFENIDVPQINSFVKENDIIRIGNSEFLVIETPGHAAGSICLYNEKAKILFTGDVLFKQGIGRTDLPTGDYDTLINSIVNKLCKLPDDTQVFPGHSEPTTIGYEKKFNHFISKYFK